MKCVDPDQNYPFNGYRRIDGDYGVERDLYPTLAHFFESEKFRGSNEALRQELTLASSPTYARKLARRHKDSWRKDWVTMRARVLAAGLSMQMVQSKAVLQLMRATQLVDVNSVGANARIGGLPIAFVASVARQLMAHARDRSVGRVAVLALRRYTPADIVDRLDALYKQRLPMSGTVYIGNDADIAVERWMMNRAVPLRFFGYERTRFRAAENPDLLRKTNSIVLCAPAARTEIAEFLGLAPGHRVLNLTRKADPEPQ